MIVRICDANRQILSTKSYSVTESASVQKNIEEVKEDKIEKRIVVDDTANLETYINNRYPKVPTKVAKKIAAKVTKYTALYNVPLPVIVGIIEVESKFNKSASSGKGDEGLMQIRYSVWKKEFKIKKRRDLYDINTNLKVGIAIFDLMLHKSKGNLNRALGRYCGSSKGAYAKRVYVAVRRFERWQQKREALYACLEHNYTACGGL